MDLRSMTRKLLVVAFAAFMLVGFASSSRATVKINSAEIILIGDEEPSGALGNGMVSIGDTIVVKVNVSPADSILYVIADMRKYGGSEAETLYTFKGQLATASTPAWVPSCSDGGGYAEMTTPAIAHPDSPYVKTEHWTVCMDTTVAGAWIVTGSVTGTLPDTAWTDSLCYLTDGTDTLFSFMISDTSGICCTSLCDTCDHFEFETYAYVPPDTIYTDTLIVKDGGIYWIDNTPCKYVGHTDPSALITAVNILYPDSLFPYDIDTLSTEVPEDQGGTPVDYDTHHTTYAQLSDPGGTGAEFLEGEDYYYLAMTDSSGLAAVFGLPDNILNPTSLFGFAPDTLYTLLDMRRLSHANGNDDIYNIYWDAHILGNAYSDTSQPNIDENGWWIVQNPWYGSIDCTLEFNGVTDVWQYAFPILPGSTDVDAGQQLAMKWISDSGDTTYFGTLTNVIDAGIDNKIPDYIVDDSPTDSVTVDDITFVADMDNAGHDDYLNPASVDNPVADWVQVKIDLEGLDDLSDLAYGFADMMNIGFNLADTTTTPLGWDFVSPMHALSPIWGSDSVDVLASPPSPYGYDQDSIVTRVWLFDDAGNGMMVGPKDSTLAIDNQIPYVDPDSCIANAYIYVEIAQDVAPYTGYANVGEPTNNIYDENGNDDPLDDYTTRDKIIAHANFGDALGADEVQDVWMINDPFCVDSLILYDDGTHGDDVTAGDKNYTGHARVEVADDDFCAIDTDEDPLYFEVKVKDDAGNIGIIPSCLGVKYDNEIPTISAENVSIMFWDDPETFGVDGDVDGDGIVTVGDYLIFEWRAQDEVWDDTEIDSVKVLASSIDPTYTGTIMLYWNPSGGIYRNYWPDAGMGSPYAITAGSVDGETLCADFCVWDNAGNSTGWKNFCSELVLDNMGTVIDCADIAITFTGADTVASVGDTLTFEYDDGTEDLVAIMIDVSGVCPTTGTVVLNADNSWTGSCVVEAGSIDADTTFSVTATDDVGNEYNCSTDPIAIDNQPPSMSCANAYVRLWDYVDNIPTPIVNVGDNLTAIYFDRDGDVDSVVADFSNYADTLAAKSMVFGFDGGPAYKWGYRIDPVPEGTIDQGPGGLGTKVMLTAYDDAGNSSSMWFCPIWFDENVLPDPVDDPGDTTYACNAECVGVDTELPGPPDPDAITFELLETSNGIANVGDRLRIIVNMGDPTEPGYDMNWETAAVEVDAGQYGYGDYIDLTDDAWSAGGEGDGRFSYFFFYNADDGYEWIEGLPILPGALDVPAGDVSTKIKVRSMDDAGNYSHDWVESDVLVLAGTGEEVPVDNELPSIDPDDIAVSFVDNDDNGILDIGDEVTISVDMTNAPGGDVTDVWANLYDWGYPSMDMVPLTAESPVYSITFTVEQNEGEFCNEELFENEPCLLASGLLGNAVPHPEVEVVAKDDADNWSDYDNAMEPYANGDGFSPILDSWPFTYDWTSSGELTDLTADTDAPDPVNWDYEDNASGVTAFSLPDGRVGLKMFYDFDPRNTDVDIFYVYGDIDTPGEIDWNTYLGQPIPAGNVEDNYTDGIANGDYVWVSDVLPEREEAYHFGVLAVDDAGNMSDPNLTWITGEFADTTHYTGYVQAYNDDDQPTNIADEDGYFLGYLNSEYWQVVYVEWYARIKDLDPLTEGDQPGEWLMFDHTGQWPQDQPGDFVEPPYESDADALVDAFDDVLVNDGCYTFEIIIVPWDESGNHPTLEEALPYAFTFTYDNWDPVLTSVSVNGDPGFEEDGLVVSGSAEIEATATDECDLSTELTWELYANTVGGDYLGILLDKQTLPAGTPYTYTWDLTNYPAGETSFDICVTDMAGNRTCEEKTFEVLDETAPSGIFAFDDDPDNQLYDGMHLAAYDSHYLAFLVQWPSELGTGNYDVAQVAIDYMVEGSLDDWTPLTVITDYDDSTPDEGGFYHYDYWFYFDTSGFSDGDVVDLRATIMDKHGNTSEVTVSVVIAAGYPILTLSSPDVIEVCGENRVAGDLNLVGTETSSPTDTYQAFWMYKRHDEPDIGDCGWGGRWAQPDSMFPVGTTQETVWRTTIDTRDFEDGCYDFMLCTMDVGGNWSWDKDHDWCVDEGAFAEAVANGMGMTICIQNEAPEVRIRSVNEFEPTDQEGDWGGPVPVYVKCDETITTSVWTASTCDVDRVEYYLAGADVVNGGEVLVATSSDPGDNYQVTFPSSGGVCDYLVEGALQHGYANVELIARLYDKLGNVSEYTVDVTLLDQEAATVFITNPAPDSYVRGWVELEADAMNDDEVYDVTYQYRPVGSMADWTTIATTRAHDGDPWDTDANGDQIVWKTDLLADGVYELRAVSRDANLAEDPNPQVITVTVDNTAPVVDNLGLDPAYTVESALPEEPSTWIGGRYVDIATDVTDAGGVAYVRFWYKPVEDHIDDATYLGTDYDAPFAYAWSGTWFENVVSGWYDIGVTVIDRAGNSTFYSRTVYIDHCDPYAAVTKINDDETPNNSNFWGVITINGSAEDGGPNVDCNYQNQEFHSGIYAAQFQYSTDYGATWHNLGEMIVGAGPDYSIDWDVSFLVGQWVDIRLAAVDNVGNWSYSDFIMIYVSDQIAPKATIAGVDPEFSYVWAVAETHGQFEYLTVRFEYAPAVGTIESATWTPIGEVQEAYSTGVYGVPWHFADLPDGDYWVRAVAYDDDYDPYAPETADLYDHDPATMLVSIHDGAVTMASTEAITGLTREGNLEDCEELRVKAYSQNKPTIIVVFDDDPEDHYDEPSVERLLDLERPDDQTCWVDYFSLYDLDPWGHAWIIATQAEDGTVGAVTSEFNVFKVTDNEGTKGTVTQDGLSIDIPQGAVSFSEDGLIIVKVPKLIEDATVEPVTPIGDPVMVSFFNYYCGSQYTFQNGLRASVTMTYDESLIPEGVSEEDLRVALWNESGRYWTTSSLQNFTVDTEANTITFTTRTTGTFSVVAHTSFRITTPVILPRCGEYTGAYPKICTVIEDLLNGVNTDEIKVALSGPAEDPIFDNMTIYYDGSASGGWDGEYDDVSHMLCLELEEDYDFGTLLGSRTADGGWTGYGLPGGTYTLDVYAINNAGDPKHLQHTFKVDATAPAVDFIGTYVAANPTFFLDLSDNESGVDEETVFMDIYAVRAHGYETEYKEYLGTATPSSMQFDWDEGTVTVTFDQMTYGFTLDDGMSVDVILYDGDVTMRIDEGEASSYYNYFCDDDDQQCRGYLEDDGVADCAGNHANPVWRRYTVDAVPPTMKVVSAEGERPIEIEVTDTGSGIDDQGFKLNGQPIEDPDWTPTSSSKGILRIDVGEGPVDIDITATDAVGNFAVLEVEEGAAVVDLVDVKSYPNPFDPYNGEYARIEYTLAKGAHVTIAIYDFAGEKVKTIFDGYRSAGTYTEKWYGGDESGKTVASGAYIGYVKADDGSKTVTKNLKIGVYKGGND